MSNLVKQILKILEAQGNEMASVMFVLDQLEKAETRFSMAEFDETVDQLRRDGVVRVTNSSDPRNNWQLQRR